METNNCGSARSRVRNVSRPTLKPTQSFIYGHISFAATRTEREDNRHPSPRAKVKHTWSHTSVSPYAYMAFNFPARRQRAVKCKMALTSQQRSWCVLEFRKTNSVVTVQRAFKLKFNVEPPTNKSILKWHRNFIERGCICDQMQVAPEITGPDRL
jgi:hypothetical protein